MRGSGAGRPPHLPPGPTRESPYGIRKDVDLSPIPSLPSHCLQPSSEGLTVYIHKVSFYGGLINLYPPLCKVHSWYLQVSFSVTMDCAYSTDGELCRDLWCLCYNMLAINVEVQKSQHWGGFVGKNEVGMVQL